MKRDDAWIAFGFKVVFAVVMFAVAYIDRGCDTEEQPEQNWEYVAPPPYER